MPLAIGKVVKAEGNQLPVRSDHMNATSLQSLQVYIPGVLESHSRNAQKMALCAIRKVHRCIEHRLGIFPMLADIFSCMLRSASRIGID